MGKKILLVDDDPLVIKTLQKCLHGYGYEIESVLSGVEAVQKVRECDYDLIISDVRMPNMDGVEMITQIRKLSQERDHKREIPAIMITGYSNDRAYRQAMELGVADFLHKPFELEQFVKVVRKNLDPAAVYQRASARIPLNVSIEVVNPESSLRIAGQLQDVSEQGIGLWLEERLSLQAMVSLKWSSSTGRQIQMQGKVIHSTPIAGQPHGFYCGVRLLDGDMDALKQALVEISVRETEQYLDLPLPEPIRENLKNDYLLEKMDQRQIMEAIDFTPPFLKVEKILLLGRDHRDLPNVKGLAMGFVSTKDTAGHYNETLFLAMCGYLMASSASVHLAILFPSTAPQVIEANGVKPLVFSDAKENQLWKPSQTGTPFFVESRILKKKMQLVVMETKVSFGRVMFGIIQELKLVLTPKESIWSAKEIPFLQLYD
ncbi:MAG: response regulator [Candidatus Omnitrophica bacterium]|nr:response regulator [Candidatus Omnitrophota bacterium]